MSEPVIRVEPAWDDAAAVQRLIERRGPFPTLAEFEEYGDVGTLPWFRERWAVDAVALFPEAQPLLHNAHFVAAAQRVSGARVVRPQIVILNLMGPQPAGPPHIDTPSFRGLARGKTPTHLLILMGASGLFRRWSVPIASAITWWYAGPAGDFEYWPRGPQGPVARERAPFSNVALVGDNDSMFHRVGAIGDPARYLPAGTFTTRAQLRYASDGSAEVLEDGALRWRFAPGELRLSILWKAHAFADERAAALHDDHSDDLTPERIIDVFREDLERRGLEGKTPVHPFRDPEWVRLLASTYRIPTPAA